jgi:hypothetical protein
VLRLVLGTCPTLATTTSAVNCIGMGAAATFVLVCSNIAISLLRKVIPDKVRLPAYIVVIAGFTTVVQMLVKAFLPAIDKALGIYLPLIVVNCIILGRAEAFAGKNSVGLSALDGLGIQPGDEVTSVAGGLACGPVFVKAAAVQPWAATLPPFPGDPAGRRRLATNLDALRAAIVTSGRVGGLQAYIAGTAGTAMERELAARAAALAAAVGAGETDGMVTAGRRLVGLGTGLTPSGDDFLAGLMIIFKLPAGPFGGR